jgi:hypothetical protein
LPKVGVVVKAKLGVHAEHVAALDLGERVDLDHGRVLLLEDVVQLDKDVGRLFLRVGLEAELLRDREGELLREALLERDRGRDDGRRVVASNILDAARCVARSARDVTGGE